MTDDAGSARTLSFKELDELVRELHGIGEPSSALLARFKHFWKMDLLDRRPGRGSKVGYAFEEVLKIVLVFEMSAAGLPPTRSANVVRSNWRWMAGLVIDGWTVARSVTEGDDGWPEPPEQGDLAEGSQLIVVYPDILGDAAIEGEEGRRSAVVAMTRRAMAAFISLPWSSRLSSLIVVDPAVLAGSLRRALPPVTGWTIGEVDDAFRRYAASGAGDGGDPMRDGRVMRS